MKKRTLFTLILSLLAIMFFMIVPVSVQAKSKKNPYSFDTSSKTLYSGWHNYLSDIKGAGEYTQITYRSEDETIAAVSEEGEITPLAPGKTLIIADITEKNSTYTCTMQVTVKAPYSKITASTSAMTINSDFTFELKRYGHNSPVTWTLSGEGLADIQAVSATDCLIHAKAAGDVMLTANCGDESFSYNIRIYDGEGELFFITPESEPANSLYPKMNTYNDKTKHYYLIRSHLEKLNNLKGGVLILGKGTYVITNTLCIPSNTSVILEDGATILKSEDTGTSYLAPTYSLFQTVSYTNASKEAVFSKYNGEKNIKIIGIGNATIDLNNIKCQGIIAAHCKNVTISGLSFKNMNTYHFIEIAAGNKVTVRNNYFYGSLESSTNRKEAINIDAPDEATKGFNQYWTSFDKTPDKDIYITDNFFYDMECGVGTHKYSEGSVHTNINILRNTFINCRNYAIRCMNWKKPVIKDNSFIYSEDSVSSIIAIIINGTENPLITENRFENVNIPVSFYHWKNSGYGSEYAPIYNKLGSSYATALKKNYLVNVENHYYEYYPIFDDFDDNNRETHEIIGY